MFADRINIVFFARCLGIGERKELFWGKTFELQLIAQAALSISFSKH